jgi:hypothetical protein
MKRGRAATGKTRISGPWERRTCYTRSTLAVGSVRQVPRTRSPQATVAERDALAIARVLRLGSCVTVCVAHDMMTLLVAVAPVRLAALRSSLMTLQCRFAWSFG